MAMDSFFAYLKHAREASGIPLEEISDVTLINLKMLEALERGDIAALPQAYVRAFIREYAATIGLDPQDTMRRYDAWLQEHPDLLHEPKVQETEPVADASAGPMPGLARLAQIPVVWKVLTAIAVLILVDVALWKILDKEPRQKVRERPFREVVHEQEERARHAARTGADATPETHSDSLTLFATTTDSVWMQIALDDSLMLEHFLYPRTSKQWKAKHRFVLVKVGNPMAISFTLNQKPITIPVRPGTIARNVTIDRSMLRQ